MHDKVLETLSAAIEMTPALDDVTAAKLAKAQVVLMAQILEELRQLREAMRKNGGHLAAEDVKRILGPDFPTDNEETYSVIAHLAKDEAKLKRARQRVLETEDVKNPTGLLIRILQKWS
jgi:ribosomal protein L16 Arg81 hydroxylase